MTTFSKTISEEDLKNFTNEIADLLDQGKLPFAIHLSSGNEKDLLDIFNDINDDDYVLSTHRNHYHALLHGLPYNEVKKKIIDGQSMFMFNRSRNFFVSAIIGGTPAIAAGIALALKKKKSKRKVWCFIGDGIEDTGHFYEAARYVESHNLPCKFVIEDNGYAVGASKTSRWGSPNNPFNDLKCVKRYFYSNVYPHIRTNNFAPLDILKKTLSDFEKNREPFGQQKKQTISIKKKNTNLSYKDSIKEAMTTLGKQNYHFIGYSITPGDAMGSLKDVDSDQKIETPVAENLMVGLATGMSIEGINTVVFFERHDFMLVAADAIGNHLDKIKWISHNEYNPKVILKTVVDDGGLFYSGPTHSQDFTKVFKEMVSFPVVDLHIADDVVSAYKEASEFDGSVMVVEHKKYI